MYRLLRHEDFMRWLDEKLEEAECLTALCSDRRPDDAGHHEGGEEVPPGTDKDTGQSGQGLGDTL